MAWADKSIGTSSLAGRTKKPKQQVSAMPKNSRKPRKRKNMLFTERDWNRGNCPHHIERCRHCQQKVGKGVRVDWLEVQGES